MPAVLPATEYFTSKGGVSDSPSGWIAHAFGKKGPSGFGSPTTAEQVVAKWSGELNGSPKVFIITGATGGLGLETAAVLAQKGAEVILTARSQARGDAALAAVKKRAPNAKASLMMLELASLKSVREFAAAFKATGKPLHALILNAGVMFCPFELSVDGHEMQFATNHLGHFLLTKLLLDVMLDSATSSGIPGRIVSVSSIGHQLYKYPGDIRFDKLDSPEGYDQELGYGQSKLCNILLARQLNVLLEGKPIIATACHPGVITSTDLGRHMNGVAQVVLQILGWGGFRIAKTVPQGAATQVYLATAEGVQAGEYYLDCNLAQASTAAHSKQLAKKLWEVSEEMCTE